MRTIVFILSQCTLFHFGLAQGDTTRRGGFAADDVIESIFDNTSDENNLQLLLDDLEYLRNNPVNLRTATYSDLIKLPFVSPLLAEKILLLQDTVQLVSLEQLRLIPEMSEQLLLKFSPFVTVRMEERDDPWLSISSFELRTRAERRLQIQDGFRRNKFLGDRNSTYQRVRTGNNWIQVAAVFEKDAGEQYGDGFAAGYFQLQNYGMIRKFVLGNYSLTAGQGLVLARNISTSKGSNTIGQIRKRGENISPSTSTDEFRYFQGAAAMLKIEYGTFIPFYSRRFLPASVDTTQQVTSFYTSGIYRTPSDLSKRNRVEEITYGGIFSTELIPHARIGASVLNIGYDKQLRASLYDFANKKTMNAYSVFMESSVEKINVFGEAATNDGQSISTVAGGVFTVSRALAVSYHHRFFTQGYVNPLARPFGERDNIGDGEIGNYLGISIDPIKQISFSAYVDHYELPSQTGFGLIGKEYFVQMDADVTKTFDLVAHIRTKRRSQTGIRLSDDERQQVNYRIGYKFHISRGVTLSQRFEFVHVQYFPSQFFEKGVLTFLEIGVKKPSSPLSLKSRFVVFDTDSYDSRLYQYESDVPGSFSNPPLYGKGVRWYCIASYRIMEKFSFSLRYSETKKLQTAVIGSGDDEIIGNLDNQLTLQLDFSL